MSHFFDPDFKWSPEKNRTDPLHMRMPWTFKSRATRPYEARRTGPNQVRATRTWEQGGPCSRMQIFYSKHVCVSWIFYLWHFVIPLQELGLVFGYSSDWETDKGVKIFIKILMHWGLLKYKCANSVWSLIPIFMLDFFSKTWSVTGSQ